MRKIILQPLVLLFILLVIKVSAQQKIEKWSRFELVLNHPNPEEDFLNIELSAKFFNNDTSFVVSGFYDGNNQYKIRFMPQEVGTWHYTTSSNIAKLNKLKGEFECVPASGYNHGMVKVSGEHNFRYADGKQFYPFGTTAYAWIHMGNELQEETLKALKNSGFNKVRMCIFPKNYDLVKEEPGIYPFLIKEVKKDAAGNEIKVWDFDRFNPAFFQHLEKRIDDLNQVGIEADLILFHPYDKGRWGFDAMTNAENIRYLKYVTARLSSFRNVWWSIANEWDLVKTKTHADWELLSRTVVANDPYRHLCSIHGSTAKYFEYWEPQFTHVSVQDEAPVMNWGAAAIIRNAYHKPVIYDEVGYEGNLKQRWGRYSPEEMTYLEWMGVIAGTYVTHGEAYWKGNVTDTIFWAKGGALKGKSWRRIAFLRKIVESGPGPLELADESRDNQTSTAGNGYYLVYFGKEMQESWLFNLPARNGQFEKPKSGTHYKVEIIDTQDMTITPCSEFYETTKVIDYRLYDKDYKKVRLPLKPYIALRITEIAN